MPSPSSKPKPARSSPLAPSRRAGKPVARSGRWRPVAGSGLAGLAIAAAVWALQGPRFAGESRWPPPARFEAFLAPVSAAFGSEVDGAAPVLAAEPTSIDLQRSNSAAIEPSSVGQGTMALVPAGKYWIGSPRGAEDEQPRHAAQLDAFWIDLHEVTMAEFAAFVRATDYITIAQRVGYSWVYDAERKCWRPGQNACWRLPDGRQPAAPNEPVTQVAWSDAEAYARWAGKRLPSEAEWEAAAAGGLNDAIYPWGRELRPQGRYEANYWQGWFPDQDLGRDGYRGVAPVRSYRANRYGLYDMAGNVAEWCADWHSADYYQSAPSVRPPGPAQGEAKVVRGGSWLSAENVHRSLMCIYAREHLPPPVARQDLGFRCVRDVSQSAR